MSPVRILAEWTVGLATALTPADRKSWVMAMRAELHTIESDGQALAWAGGGLTAAMGWALRAEAVFLAALIGICFGDAYLIPPAMALTKALGAGTWLQQADTANTLILGSAALTLSLCRPRRILATVLLMPAVIGRGGATGFLAIVLPQIVADPLAWRHNHPPVPNWEMALLFIWSFWWPALAGAALAWLTLQLRRRWAQNRSPR
jgi:hypothetical protein